MITDLAPVLTADEICDDDEWADYLARIGPGPARNALCNLKGDLRNQRRARIPDPDDREAKRENVAWLRAQARFEGHVNRRLAEVEALLSASTASSGNRLRKGMTELVDTIGKLARAIDGTDLEYLLDDLGIVLGSEYMTLSDALDTGRFDRR